MRPISYHFNMRRILVWILAMLMVSLLYAGSWGVGIEAGYTLGLYDQRGGISDFERYSPGHAFSVSVPAEYHIYDWLSVATGISYEGRAYGYERSVAGNHMFDLRNTEHFFLVPLSLRFSFGNDFARGFVGAGGYLGVRFLSEESGYVYGINIGNMHGFGELDPAADNLFDAGLLAEAGVGFSVVDDGELYLALRYRYSLTELDRNYQENRIKRYIDTFSVAVGYSFRLGGDA